LNRSVAGYDDLLEIDLIPARVAAVLPDIGSFPEERRLGQQIEFSVQRRPGDVAPFEERTRRPRLIQLGEDGAAVVVV